MTPRFERIARFAPVIGVFIGGAQAALWLLGRELGCPTPAAPLVLALGYGPRDSHRRAWTPAMAGRRPPLPAAMADSRIGASGLRLD